MEDKDGKQGDQPRKVSIETRGSKVSISGFASLPEDFAWVADLERMIPSILAGRDILELSSRVVRAAEEGRPIILMMGAHVVKCGLGPLIGELVQKTESEILATKNFGRKSLNEIKEILAEMGLNFGMKVEHFPSEPEENTEEEFTAPKG